MTRRRLALIAQTFAAAATWLLFAATLLGRYASHVSPERGGFWAVAALLLPVALLCDAVLLVGWLVCRRWRLAALPAAACVLCAGYLSALMQPPSLHAAKERPRDLRIMTLNACGFLYPEPPGTTAPAIARLAEREKVDVMFLQEAVPGSDFPKDSVAALFSGYFPYFVRDDLIALGSRYPIVKHHYLHFPNDQSTDYMWADVVIGTDTIRFFSIHLKSTGISDLRRKFREEEKRRIPPREVLNTLALNSRMRASQVETLRRIIDTTRYPVILTGDFNDPPGTYTYRRLKGSLTDSFRAAGHGYGGTYRGLGGLMRIDYIFCDRHFEAVDLYMPSAIVSDHSAVIADLRFAR